MSDSKTLILALWDVYERVVCERYAYAGMLKELGVSEPEKKVAEYLERPDIRVQLDYELEVFRKMRQQLPEFLAGNPPTAEFLEQLKRKIH